MKDRIANINLSDADSRLGSVIEFGTADSSDIYIGHHLNDKLRIYLVGKSGNKFTKVTHFDAGNGFAGFFDNTTDNSFLVTANPGNNESNYISTATFSRQTFDTGSGPEVLVIAD